MKDQSFRSANDDTIFQARCDMMMHDVISFVGLDPTNPAHRLTLDDYSLLFFRVQELKLSAHARTLWIMLRTQQAQARLEWAAALAAPLPPPNSSPEVLAAAETSRAMPTLLQVPYKLVGLMIQTIVGARGAPFAARLLFKEILPRTVPAPIITRQTTTGAAGFQPEPPPAFEPAPSTLAKSAAPAADDAASTAADAPTADLVALSSPLLALHPDPSSWVVEFERAVEAGQAHRPPQAGGETQTPQLGAACFEAHASLFAPILRAFAQPHSRLDESQPGRIRSRALAEVIAFWDSIPSWGRNHVAYSILLGALELASLLQTPDLPVSFNGFEQARRYFAEMQREHHTPWPDQELTLDSQVLERLLERLETRVANPLYRRAMRLAPEGAQLAQDYFAAAVRLRAVTPQITESTMLILIRYRKHAEAIQALQQACALEAAASAGVDSVPPTFADIDCFVIGLNAAKSAASAKLLGQQARARFAEVQRLLSAVHLHATSPDSKANSERILALGAREKALRPSPRFEELLLQKTTATARAAPKQMISRRARARVIQPDSFCGLQLSSSPAARAHNAALRAAELADPSSPASQLLHSLRALICTTLPASAREIEDAVVASAREGSRASEVPWTMEALLVYLRCYACLPHANGGAKAAGAVARTVLNLFPPTSSVFVRVLCVEMAHWDAASSLRAIGGWRLKMQQGQGLADPVRFSPQDLHELRTQARKLLASSAPVLSRAQKQMMEKIERWEKEDEADAAAATPTAASSKASVAVVAPPPPPPSASPFNRSALMARFYALASGHAGPSAADDALDLAAHVPLDAWDAALRCAYLACFVPSGSWRHCERIFAAIQERHGLHNYSLNAARNLIQCYYFAASNLETTAASVAQDDRISEAQMVAKVELLWRKLQAAPKPLQQRHRRRSLLAASKGAGPGAGAADTSESAAAAAAMAASDSHSAPPDAAASSSLSPPTPPPCPFSVADLSHLINTARKCFLDGEVLRWGQLARQLHLISQLSPIAQEAVRKVEQREAAA